MVTHPIYVTARTIGLAILFSMIGFVLISTMPGDPLDSMLEDNPDFSYEDYLKLRSIYGLDDPITVRYV
jgi:peptide/nickel transport system permease protein